MQWMAKLSDILTFLISFHEHVWSICSLGAPHKGPKMKTSVGKALALLLISSVLVCLSLDVLIGGPYKTCFHAVPPPPTPLLLLSIVYNVTATVVTWYASIFEVLRQEAIRRRKPRQDSVLIRQGLGVDIVQENALKLERIFVYHDGLNDVNNYDEQYFFNQKIALERAFLGPRCWCGSKSSYHQETLGVTILIPVS